MISKKKAKEIARNLIQQQLARATYLLEDEKQYNDTEKELIEKYLDKDCERMLKVIGKEYFTF